VVTALEITAPAYPTTFTARSRAERENNARPCGTVAGGLEVGAGDAGLGAGVAPAPDVEVPWVTGEGVAAGSTDTGMAAPLAEATAIRVLSLVFTSEGGQ
jgi:hypothetical protein